MGIVHDLSFTIAVGAGRWAKTWRNTETTWSAFLARIRETVRTGETVAEYKAMSKADKDAKKDVGGFVGGTLQSGRRLQTHVVSRQLVSLDADSADVVVKADELTDANRAQIEDIVTRKTEIAPENIVITPIHE